MLQPVPVPVTVLFQPLPVPVAVAQPLPPLVQSPLVQSPSLSLLQSPPLPSFLSSSSQSPPQPGQPPEMKLSQPPGQPVKVATPAVLAGVKPLPDHHESSYDRV